MSLPQNLRTVQPSAVSFSVTSTSRCILRSILGIQNSLRDLNRFEPYEAQVSAAEQFINNQRRQHKLNCLPPATLSTNSLSLAGILRIIRMLTRITTNKRTNVNSFLRTWAFAVGLSEVVVAIVSLLSLYLSDRIITHHRQKIALNLESSSAFTWQHASVPFFLSVRG